MKLVCRMWLGRLERLAIAGDTLDESPLLARHVAHCPHCRRVWSETGKLAHELRTRFAVPQSSDRFVSSVMARAETIPPGRSSYPVLRLAAVGAVASAALLLLWTKEHSVRHGGATPNGSIVTETQPVPPVFRKDNHPSAVAGTHPPHGDGRVVSVPKSPRRPKVTLPLTPSDAPPRTVAARLPDWAFLDGRRDWLSFHWAGNAGRDQRVTHWLTEHLPPVRDAFVQVPLPRVASTDTQAAGPALRGYEKEAKVVDPRLFRRVTLALKATPLSDLCDKLHELTGVTFQASRGVGDENVTVFVDDCPTRDLMQEITRLFGYNWARSGEPGAYTYTLIQDLRSQLAEEELRSRDAHAALLALDEQMGRFVPYLNMSREELAAREKTAKSSEKQVLSDLLRQWGPVQVYFHLSPAQQRSLANGERLRFEGHADDAEHALPGEWRVPLLESSRMSIESVGGRSALVSSDSGSATPLTQIADAEPTLGISLTRSELGQVRLNYTYGAYIASRPELGKPTYGPSAPVATGRSPAVSRPENARWNAALENEPPFRKKVRLEPQSSCPEFAPGVEHKAHEPESYVDGEGTAQFGKEPVHVFTADVWEAVHRVSGMPIVADAYSHVVRQSSVTVKDATLFDALAHAGDEMGVRWRKDGDFLLARSTSHFWDKIKEVPRRQLARWRSDRETSGGLPLEDLLEMARLRDDQINSAIIGKVVEHCWGLEEWGLVGNSGFRMGIVYTEVLPFARLLASLNRAQLAAAGSPTGIRLESLTPTQQEPLLRRLLGRGMPPDFVAGMSLRYVYVPTNQYLWSPIVHSFEESDAARRWPTVFAATKEAALAEARRWSPNVDPSQIQKSNGALEIICMPRSGEPWRIGGPSVGIAAH